MNSPSIRGDHDTLIKDGEPYPGLRPFQGEQDARLFFGRAEHIALFTLLERTRFAAVLGDSGAGKSSLVRAGLIPALRAGLLGEHGTDWTVITVSPGGGPLTNLASQFDADTAKANGWDLPQALDSTYFGVSTSTSTLRGKAESRPVYIGNDAVARLSSRTGLGLADLLDECNPKITGNLLLVIDQFEEIFDGIDRGEISLSEAQAFVSLLSHSSEQRRHPVYVVLTMRSDFLGRCSLFDGFPEKLSQCQFLTPRLRTDQLLSAIELPPAFFNGEVASELAYDLALTASTANLQDGLPLLQHALRRLWDLENANNNDPRNAIPQSSQIFLGVETVRLALGSDSPLLKSEPIDWTAVLTSILNRHGEELFNSLSASNGEQQVAKRIFAWLAARKDGKEIRQPRSIKILAELIIAEFGEMALPALITVLNTFRAPSSSFLFARRVGIRVDPGAELDLEHDEDLIIDISHEALIRCWKVYQDWLDEEDKVRAAYDRLKADVIKKRLVQGGWLAELRRLFELNVINAAWSTQVFPISRVKGQAESGSRPAETTFWICNNWVRLSNTVDRIVKFGICALATIAIGSIVNTHIDQFNYSGRLNKYHAYITAQDNQLNTQKKRFDTQQYEFKNEARLVANQTITNHYLATELHAQQAALNYSRRIVMPELRLEQEELAIQEQGLKEANAANAALANHAHTAYLQAKDERHNALEALKVIASINGTTASSLATKPETADSALTMGIAAVTPLVRTNATNYIPISAIKGLCDAIATSEFTTVIPYHSSFVQFASDGSVAFMSSVRLGVEPLLWDIRQLPTHKLTRIFPSVLGMPLPQGGKWRFSALSDVLAWSGLVSGVPRLILYRCQNGEVTPFENVATTSLGSTEFLTFTPDGRTLIDTGTSGTSIIRTALPYEVWRVPSPSASGEGLQFSQGPSLKIVHPPILSPNSKYAVICQYVTPEYSNWQLLNLLRNTFPWYKVKAHSSCLLLEVVESLFTMPFFLSCEDCLVVWRPPCNDCVKDNCEFMSSGRDAFRSS